MTKTTQWEYKTFSGTAWVSVNEKSGTYVKGGKKFPLDTILTWTGRAKTEGVIPVKVEEKKVEVVVEKKKEVKKVVKIVEKQEVKVETPVEVKGSRATFTHHLKTTFNKVELFKLGEMVAKIEEIAKTSIRVQNMDWRKTIKGEEFPALVGTEIRGIFKNPYFIK